MVYLHVRQECPMSNKDVMTVVITERGICGYAGGTMGPVSGAGVMFVI